MHVPDVHYSILRACACTWWDHNICCVYVFPDVYHFILMACACTWWDYNICCVCACSRCILFHPDGMCLYSGSKDMIKVYHWEPLELYDTVPVPWGEVCDMSISNTQLVRPSHRFVLFWEKRAIETDRDRQRVCLLLPTLDITRTFQTTVWIVLECMSFVCVCSLECFHGELCHTHCIYCIGCLWWKGVWLLWSGVFDGLWVSHSVYGSMGESGSACQQDAGWMRSLSMFSWWR